MSHDKQHLRWTLLTCTSTCVNIAHTHTHSHTVEVEEKENKTHMHKQLKLNEFSLISNKADVIHASLIHTTAEGRVRKTESAS